MRRTIELYDQKDEFFAAFTLNLPDGVDLPGVVEYDHRFYLRDADRASRRQPEGEDRYAAIVLAARAGN